MRFSAVVMAGGQSRRMGRDKVSLPAAPYRTLLERQLAVLTALGPCEILVSARRGQRIPHGVMPHGVTIVYDDGAAGPLGGLIASLRAANAHHVLVLAVDVAVMAPWMLRRILGAAPESTDDVGVIPRTAVAPQPLAALWPRRMLPLAESQLSAGGDLSLRALMARGVEAGWLRWLDVPEWDERRFINWNRPADVFPGPGRATPLDT